MFIYTFGFSQKITRVSDCTCHVVAPLVDVGSQGRVCIRCSCHSPGLPACLPRIRETCPGEQRSRKYRKARGRCSDGRRLVLDSATPAQSSERSFQDLVYSCPLSLNGSTPFKRRRPVVGSHLKCSLYWPHCTWPPRCESETELPTCSHTGVIAWLTCTRDTEAHGMDGLAMGQTERPSVWTHLPGWGMRARLTQVPTSAGLTRALHAPHGGSLFTTGDSGR